MPFQLLLPPIEGGKMDPHHPTRSPNVSQLLGQGKYPQPEAIQGIIITHGGVSSLLDVMVKQQDAPPHPPGRHLARPVATTQKQDNLTAQRLAVNEALSSLSRLVVPPSRQQLHNATVTALTHRQAALANLIAVGSRQDVTVVQVQSASAICTEALDHVREIAEDIRRLRVGAPTE